MGITQLFRLNTAISKREGLEPNNPPNTYHLRQLGKPLGATFLGIAILVLLIGARRYFESQVCPPCLYHRERDQTKDENGTDVTDILYKFWIIRGKFPASRGSVFFVTAISLILISASLIIVVTVDPTVFEKR